MYPFRRLFLEALGKRQVEHSSPSGRYLEKLCCGPVIHVRLERLVRSGLENMQKGFCFFKSEDYVLHSCLVKRNSRLS